VSQPAQDPRVAAIVALFEHLTVVDIARLPEFYAPQVRFKDPFNDVQGIAPVQRIFAHMFNTLEDPRFFVRDVIHEGNACFLSWDFVFRFKHAAHTLQTVRGASHLVFAPSGLVSTHRDYWDAAEELYEKLPLLGALMRWLKRRLAA
jgi:ketosteroid isomerase-like protein